VLITARKCSTMVMAIMFGIVITRSVVEWMSKDTELDVK